MKMIWAVIRSSAVQRVIEALEKTGITAVTRIGVSRNDREPKTPAGLPCGASKAEEMLMLVLSEHDVAKAVIAIRAAAKAGLKETPEAGDLPRGKIFVTYVEDLYTIRVGQKDGGALLYENNHRNHPA